MNRPNFFLLSISLMLLIGVFGGWLWYFQPDCYVTVSHLEERSRWVNDTTTGLASYKIISINTSDVQEGHRPHPEKDVIDVTYAYLARKFGHEPTETYSYVFQTVTLQNLSIDSAMFGLQGWVVLAALPQARILSPPQQARLAPGETGTFRFLVELPAGYDYQIVDALDEKNVRLLASCARTVTRKMVTETFRVNRRCNQCRENCEDNVPVQVLPPSNNAGIK